MYHSFQLSKGELKFSNEVIWPTFSYYITHDTGGMPITPLGLSEVIHLIILSHLSPTHQQPSSSCGCDTHMDDEIVDEGVLYGCPWECHKNTYSPIKQSASFCKIAPKFCFPPPHLCEHDMNEPSRPETKAKLKRLAGC